MSKSSTNPALDDANEVYLRSIDATLSFIAERLPPPSRSDRTDWLLVANAAALWSIVAIMLSSRFS